MLPILPLLLLLLFPGAHSYVSAPVRVDAGAAGPSYEVRLLALAVATARQERAAEVEAQRPISRPPVSWIPATDEGETVERAGKPSRDRDGPKL